MATNTMQEIDPEVFLSLSKINKDVKLAAKVLTPGEVRYCVDIYLQMQKRRVAANNATKALEKDGEPNSTLKFITEQNEKLEAQVQTFLHIYAKSNSVGQWCLSHMGVGDVVTSGLMAFIDIERAPTPGHILRFAGQDPTVKWNKGEKRPWNARLKVICYFAGLGFRYVCNKETADYGKLYKYRKAIEIERNEKGFFRDQAAEVLRVKNFRDDTKAKEFYLSGKLPPAHIDARARKWAVRLFICHLHEVMFYEKYGIAARRPYSFDVLQHPHVISPPNMHLIPGLEKVIRERSPVVSVDEYIALDHN